MSKHFTAINRKTGKQWKSTNGSFLVMYDSGYLAEVFVNKVYDSCGNLVREFYTFIPLDIKEWQTVLRKPMQNKLEKFGVYTGEDNA